MVPFKRHHYPILRFRGFVRRDCKLFGADLVHYRFQPRLSADLYSSWTEDRGVEAKMQNTVGYVSTQKQCLSRLPQLLTFPQQGIHWISVAEEN